MKKHDFYRLYDNVPLQKRYIIFDVTPHFILAGMTLNTVYEEIRAIDDELLENKIRRQQLLDAVEPFLK